MRSSISISARVSYEGPSVTARMPRSRCTPALTAARVASASRPPRRAPLQIHLVLHEHQRAGRHPRGDSAGRVREHERLGAERREEPHHARHFFRGIAFVEVRAPLRHDDPAPGPASEKEPAGMSRHRGARQAGDLLGRERAIPRDPFRQHAEAASQHESHLRNQSRAAADGAQRLTRVERLQDGRFHSTSGSRRACRDTAARSARREPRIR
jgi:hypothetical protein